MVVVDSGHEGDVDEVVSLPSHEPLGENTSSRDKLVPDSQRVAAQEDISPAGNTNAQSGDASPPAVETTPTISREIPPPVSADPSVPDPVDYSHRARPSTPPARVVRPTLGSLPGTPILLLSPTGTPGRPTPVSVPVPASVLKALQMQQAGFSSSSGLFTPQNGDDGDGDDEDDGDGGGDTGEDEEVYGVSATQLDSDLKNVENGVDELATPANRTHDTPEEQHADKPPVASPTDVVVSEFSDLAPGMMVPPPAHISDDDLGLLYPSDSELKIGLAAAAAEAEVKTAQAMVEAASPIVGSPSLVAKEEVHSTAQSSPHESQARAPPKRGDVSDTEEATASAQGEQIDLASDERHVPPDLAADTIQPAKGVGQDPFTLMGSESQVAPGPVEDDDDSMSEE
jgi:hypothetical protein